MTSDGLSTQLSTVYTVSNKYHSLGHTGLVGPCIWDLPRYGIEPVSPALASGLFTTEPPGKPQIRYFLIDDLY